MDWDDIRIFNAVVARGGLAAAAKAEAMSEHAVRRRLRNLEALCGLPLLRRTPSGLTPTPTGERLAKIAQTMAVQSSLRTGGVRGGPPLGRTVRVLIGSTPLAVALTPVFARLRLDDPGLAFDLISTEASPAALGAAADIRVGVLPAQAMPPGGHLAGGVEIGLFAHRDYLRDRETPTSVADLAAHRLIDRTASIFGPGTTIWSDLMPVGAPRRYKASEGLGVIGAIWNGVGIGLAPTFMMRDRPDMIRILPDLCRRLDVWAAVSDPERGNPTIARIHAEIVVAIGGLRPSEAKPSIGSGGGRA